MSVSKIPYARLSKNFSCGPYIFSNDSSLWEWFYFGSKIKVPSKKVATTAKVQSFLRLLFDQNLNMQNNVYRKLFSLKLLQLALDKYQNNTKTFKFEVDWNKCCAKVCFHRQSWTKYLAQSRAKLKQIKIKSKIVFKQKTRKLWHLCLRNF